MKQNSFCGNLVMDDHGKISTDPELEHRVKWLATSLYGRKSFLLPFCLYSYQGIDILYLPTILAGLDTVR